MDLTVGMVECSALETFRPAELPPQFSTKASMLTDVPCGVEAAMIDLMTASMAPYVPAILGVSSNLAPWCAPCGRWKRFSVGPLCTTWASSWLSRWSPPAVPGAYRPAPNTMSDPTV
jgi:hypothetical protein